MGIISVVCFADLVGLFSAQIERSSRFCLQLRLRGRRTLYNWLWLLPGSLAMLVLIRCLATSTITCDVFLEVFVSYSPLPTFEWSPRQQRVDEESHRLLPRVQSSLALVQGCDRPLQIKPNVGRTPPEAQPQSYPVHEVKQPTRAHDQKQNIATANNGQRAAVSLVPLAHLLVGLLEDPNELPRAPGVFGREEADRGALVPSPPATADAVDVRLVRSHPRRGRQRGFWSEAPARTEITSIE